METDLALARAVDAGREEPILRVYRWSPWCISLGKHQSQDEIDLRRCALDGIDVVHRPTGGRAILHAEELTYSVVMPAEDRGVMEVYRNISEALAGGLRFLVPEIAVAKSTPDFPKLYQTPGGIPCFSSSARYEIEYGGRKLVGSAQRRIGQTVLQHGSLLLGDAHLRLADYLNVDDEARAAIRTDLTEHTITLGEILRREVSFDECDAAIKDGFEQAWGVHFVVMHGEAFSGREREVETT